uniref:trypsin n=1 Tax=Sphaeramia orbicularis TaxID=375764 RepID=A0A672ZAN9_9TELE
MYVCKFLVYCLHQWRSSQNDPQSTNPQIEQIEQTLEIPQFTAQHPPSVATTPVVTTPVVTTPVATTPVVTTPVATTPTPAMPKEPLTDDFLGPPECLKQKLTRASCNLVFCLPWERCIEGRCSCKPPYLCPINNVSPVCGHDNRNYRSYCQVMALSCRIKTPVMSHFGKTCRANDPKFSVSVDADTHVVMVSIPDPQNAEGTQKMLLVCGKQWDMAAANVACKHHGHGYALGAVSADSVPYKTLNIDDRQEFPNSCVSVHCQGYETSLAECVIYDTVAIDGDMKVATATCYDDSTAPKDCDFTCTNGKCVSLSQTCDGVDDCGDRSDEMCCKNCRNGAFRCKTGVCVHKEAVGDKQMDCLDGADEAERHELQMITVLLFWFSEFISPKNETRASRADLESKLFCGIPNPNTVDDDEMEVRGRTNGRVKRVVGGVRAKPTQIQWQVALEEYKHIDCGGAYIGGCWVITAAHCVRPRPSAFRVKFSLWKKNRAQGTTDIVPVADIRIHPKYNASTYENDIALVQLQTLPFQQKCLQDNPAVRAVCVPWTTELFQPHHTCSISGWGRNEEGRSAQVLLWANVSLIPKCERFYGDRIRPGMMCAGDLDGSVDSCQGDSGGPLVCEDELGVSYLWGIVSWGERCGQAGFPGVYTQVAHYFEWIRLHTGWSEVTKFNS